MDDSLSTVVEDSASSTGCHASVISMTLVSKLISIDISLDAMVDVDSSHSWLGLGTGEPRSMRALRSCAGRMLIVGSSCSKALTLVCAYVRLLFEGAECDAPPFSFRLGLSGWRHDHHSMCFLLDRRGTGSTIQGCKGVGQPWRLQSFVDQFVQTLACRGLDQRCNIAAVV